MACEKARLGDLAKIPEDRENHANLWSDDTLRFIQRCALAASTEIT
jgi:hypothetical protein